jgi:RNA-binding protein Musashi
LEVGTGDLGGTLDGLGEAMDSDQGKLFIGGISWETTEEKLRDYFKSYGEVAETVIMKDRATGRARGFGFVIFADPSVADRVAGEKHTIDGRTVSIVLDRGLLVLCVR